MLKTSNTPLTLIRRSFENKYLSKDLLFLFNEIGIEKPQIKKPEIRFVRADQEALTILPSYFALM